MKTVIIQGIGFIAAGLLIGSFQCKKSRKMFLMQMCSSLTYLIHYFLLDALSGCGNITASMIRGFVYSQGKHKWAQWKAWPIILTGLNVLVAVLTWRNLMSIFPFFGTVGTTIAGWGGNGKRVRIANLFVCCPSWLIYNFYSHSIPGVLCESFTLCSIAISVIRYGWKALDGDGEEIS